MSPVEYATERDANFARKAGWNLVEPVWFILMSSEIAGLIRKKYSGFASGWGVERVLTMKEGLEIDDIRLLYSNKLEFLEQF